MNGSRKGWRVISHFSRLSCRSAQTSHHYSSPKPHRCEALQTQSSQQGARRTCKRGERETTFPSTACAAVPLPEGTGKMAASEEHDSATEALQPAAEEEEAKTFKDLVRLGDAAVYFAMQARGSPRVWVLYSQACSV